MPRYSPAAIRSIAAALLLPSVTACAGTGLGMDTLGDILGGGGGYGGRDFSGEIRGIDTRRREIEVRSGWVGSERVRYDGRTEVIYRQRRYDVRSLERGDVVRMRVDRDRGGALYTGLIQVQQSVQERRGGGGARAGARVQRFDGNVGRIDARAGWFELYRDRGGTLIVTMPYDPSRSTLDQFRRLRRGQRVRVEAEQVNSSTLVLYRFL